MNILNCTSEEYIRSSEILNMKIVRNSLIAAGVMNIGGVLLFSKCFTNAAINDADPVAMSNFGLMMIGVWGLAYIGASFIQSGIRWLAVAFAIEKLIYGSVWIKWLTENDLHSVYRSDFLAGVFYTIYGANDLAFMLFFIGLFVVASKNEKISPPC